MTLVLLPSRLLPWFGANKRDLPWRHSREPYPVWLSEIMLQQTRVEAVRVRYAEFLSRLPTIAALAAADENTLLKLWEGMGYYSRVRNLQKAAQEIQTRHGGIFPTQHNDILALSGIGEYTAGAIASICFEQPTPAVDGNVLRVLSRLLADNAPVTDAAVRRGYAKRLAAIYPAGRCGAFTQALMELGATVCLPNGAPNCKACPLHDICRASQNGNPRAYPVKAAKKPRRTEERTVFVLRCEGKIAVTKRPTKGLLAGLWQLPDVAGDLTAQEALAQAEAWKLRPTTIVKTVHRTHIFTHVQWNLTGIYLECAAEARFSWFTPAQLQENIGLPTAYRQFLEE